MKKTTTKLLSLALVLVIILGISAIPASAASNLAANPTASTVYVNGAAKAFEAYIINGNNYFKLRDLAYVLNGTAKQFEVGYDNATKAITLTTGRAYTPDGGEMANGDGKAKSASPTASRIYLNGKELNLTVYLIGGNNFFKLRDLMEAIDVFVGYDNATKAITLDTSKGYVPEGSAATPTPDSTQPSALSDLGKKLVGMWDATIQAYDEDGDVYGDGSFYLELKDDGTFKQLKVGQAQALAEYRSGVMALTYGNWHESGGNIYFTNCQFTSWDAYQEEYEKDGYTPVNMQTWKNYNDFIAKNIIHYPEGTAPFTIEEGFTSDEWGGMVIAPKLHRRIKMPPGSIEKAFDSRFVP